MSEVDNTQACPVPSKSSCLSCLAMSLCLLTAINFSPLVPPVALLHLMNLAMLCFIVHPVVPPHTNIVICHLLHLPCMAVYPLLVNPVVPIIVSGLSALLCLAGTNCQALQMMPNGSAVIEEQSQVSAPAMGPSTPLQESSCMEVTSFGKGEWPMVELTACTYQDPIPEEYEDVHMVSCYQGWGVFGVKHVTVKRRGQQRDQEGNTV